MNILNTRVVSERSYLSGQWSNCGCRLYSAFFSEPALRALTKALDDKLPERLNCFADRPRWSRSGSQACVRALAMDRPKGKLYQMDMRAVPIEGSAKHRVTTRQLDLDFTSLKRLNDNLNEFQGRFGNKYLLRVEVPTGSPDRWPGNWPGRTPHRKR